MGRFRVAEEEDDDDNSQGEDSNYFQAQHVYSSSGEEEENDTVSNWGPLVQFRQHTPQTFGVQEGEDLMEVTLPSMRHGIQPPSVTISRRRQQQQQSDEHALEEYEYDYEPPPKPKSLWSRFVIVAIVAHLLALYGPVAPPQEANSDSWEDFWIRELTGLWRTTKLIGYTVPKYVGEWVVLGLYDDVRSYYHSYQEYHQQLQTMQQWANCSITLPNDWNLQYEYEPSNIYRIVGQSRAIQITTQALDAWEQSAPLVLYFAGSRGVGKLELAKQISQRAFSHCTNTAANNATTLFEQKSPVMVIQGRTFATSLAHADQEEEEAEDESTPSSSSTKSSSRALRVQLYETLLRHIEMFPHGSVIILQHVHDFAPGIVAALVQDLTRPTHLYPASNRLEEEVVDPTPSLAMRLQQACKKTIFVFTSNVGSRTIASSIRQYESMESIPSLELDALLMHEIDTTFVDSEGKNSQGSSNLEIGSKFHAVAPFYPLEQTSLELILLQKVHQWNIQQQSANLPPLIIMKSALHAFLDSKNVEYLTMVKRSTQTPLLTFSSVGAQFLHEGNPKMNAWQAAVKRCLRDWKSERNHEIDQSEDRSDDARQEDPVVSEYAVLDADIPTQQGVLFLCPSQDGNPAVNLLYPPTTLSSCQESCRFPI